MRLRICSICKQEFPETSEFFYRDKYKASGFQSGCKPCLKKKRDLPENKAKQEARYKIWREENKEVIAEKCKKFKQANKEKIKSQSQRWRKENPEIDKRRRAEYREKNHELLKQKHREYYQRNREECLRKTGEYRKQNRTLYQTLMNQYRARKKDLLDTLTVEEWENAKVSFDNKCAYCGKQRKLCQDHFIPVSFGGHYTVDNIVPSCNSCNSSKSNNYFEQWYPSYRHYSSERESRIYQHLKLHKQDSPERVG